MFYKNTLILMVDVHYTMNSNKKKALLEGFEPST